MVVAWQPGKTATKPETSVQDRVSTFASAKTLKETLASRDYGNKTG